MARELFREVDGSRVLLREVIPCEWAGGQGLEVVTRCGETFLTSDEIPESVRYCPFCGGPIIGMTGLEREPP